MKPIYNYTVFQQLYDKGLNDYKIAKHVRCSPTTVCHWRHKNGLRPNPITTKWSTDKITAKLEKYFMDGIKITRDNMIKVNCTLTRAADKYFGSWNKALMAANLPINRIVQMNKALVEEAKHPSFELAYVLGVLCGDGYINSQYVIGLHTTDEEFATVFHRMIYAWSKIRPFWREGWQEIRGKMYYYYNVGIQAKSAHKFLTRTEQYGCYTWAVPKIVTNEPIMLGGFLSGWFDSEGNVYKYKFHRKIRGFSVNFSGLKQIQELLTKSGIKANVYRFMKCNSKSFTDSPKPYFCIEFQGKVHLTRFKEQIGFQRPSMRQKLEKLLQSYSTNDNVIRNSMRKDAIVKLRKLGYGYRKIAKELSIRRETVRYYVKKYG